MTAQMPDLDAIRTQVESLPESALESLAGLLTLETIRMCLTFLVKNGEDDTPLVNALFRMEQVQVNKKFGEWVALGAELGMDPNSLRTIGQRLLDGWVKK